MNENINLTKILEGCPIGTEFYHSVFGKVFFWGIKLRSPYPITFMVPCDNYVTGVTRTGMYLLEYEGECTLFPSKDQRDWSKFERFWDKPKKKERLDPNTLKPFDKVLVRFDENRVWLPDFFGYKDGIGYMCTINGCTKRKCIPYNEETKHLVGTKEDCPEYYKWWEG